MVIFPSFIYHSVNEVKDGTRYVCYKFWEMNTYSIVREFEGELGKYTIRPYVVCVDSCTNTIFLML